MSRRRTKKSAQQSRLIARLIGMLLMAGILIILGFFGLKFLEGVDKKSTPPTAIPTAKPGSTTPVDEPNEKPANRARYDFYHELSGRKAEVEAEIEEKVETTARVPEIKGNNFRVQVGAFREQEQANRMRARMILRDYPVTIIRNGKFYLVQVGPYKEKEEALQIQRKLKREGVDTLLKAYVSD